MPIYEFGNDFEPGASIPIGKVDVDGPALRPQGAQQSSDLATPAPVLASLGLAYTKQGRTDLARGPISGVDRSDLDDFLMPGFRALDQGMKMFWSGIRVPTKDAYRFLRIKVAGADKSVLVWRDELLNGRARLPVAALNRSKEEFNKDKFSPPYLPMAIRYSSVRGNLAVLTYRPTPWLVGYVLSVWAEHKRDAEYVKYQVLTRFNPLAEFRMFDGHVQGVVTIRFSGASDQSDKEATFEQHRLIKYEYAMAAEAWLPLPERIVPAVLGQVATIRNDRRDLLSYLTDRPGLFGERE